MNKLTPIKDCDELEPILLSIEGNIGAGKSTLLEKMRKTHPEWIFIDEPLESWNKIRNKEGKSILELFYADQRRWGYTFQNTALLTRFQNIETAVENARAKGLTGKQIFITERCLDTDYHVFARMLKDDGCLDDVEFDLYERLLDHLQKSATCVSGIIHVDTDPKECARRIKKRSRDCESEIPLTYLENLDMHQSKWVKNANVPTLATDANCLRTIEEFVEREITHEKLPSSPSSDEDVIDLRMGKGKIVAQKEGDKTSSFVIDKIL